MDYKGIAYLRRKLVQKRTRVLLRYRYYEMKNGVQYLSTIIPPQFMWMAQVLGWCGKAVDSLADRLSFREFKNDDFDLNTIFAMNNGDILPDSAMLSALISSCSFLYISTDVTGYPRLQVIDGGNATGIADPITGMLKEGYAVIERNEHDAPLLEAWFIPGRTEYYLEGKRIRVDVNRAPYPLLVPVIYRPDAMRPFGHSRISRACMSINLGVTGTTAEEAASTISGSAASMKAAFSNVLGNLSLGRDIGPSLEALGETVFTFFGNNLIPAVGNILKNLPTVINSAFSMAIKGLNLVKGNAKQILQSGAELVVQIGQAIITNIPALAEAGLALITEIGRALVETDWTEFATSAINGLRANLDTAAGEILGTDGSIVDSVLNAITENLPGILERGVEIVTNVANGILEGMPQIISTAGDLVNQFVQFLIQNAPAILAAGAQLLLNLAQGLISNLPAIISSAASIVGQLLATLASYLPDLLAQGISLVANLIAGLISMIPDIISAAGDIIKNIKEQFSNIDWAEIGKNIISGIANGIKNGVSTIIEAAKEAAQKAFEAAKKKLDINSPSRLFRKEIGYNISAGMALGISDGIPLVEYAANSISRASTSTFSGKLAAQSGRIASPGTASGTNAGRTVQVVQNIYSKAQTAADLMIECRYNAELAVMLGV